jgi:hypothetical protein
MEYWSSGVLEYWSSGVVELQDGAIRSERTASKLLAPGPHLLL